MRKTSLWPTRTIIALTLFACLHAEADAISIDVMLQANSKRPNPYEIFPIPRREALLAKSRSWPDTLKFRRRTGPQSYDCFRELFALREGFLATYPNAPNKTMDQVAWGQHIEMVHFPKLYLCGLRYWIDKNLSEIEKAGSTVDPIIQHLDVKTFDVSRLGRETSAGINLSRSAMNLIWMSYRGFRPAMLELLKLADRSPIVRLTTRFKFYLLQSAVEADLNDPLIDDLLPKLTKMLPDPDIAELKARAKAKNWPRSERMVID